MITRMPRRFRCSAAESGGCTFIYFGIRQKTFSDIRTLRLFWCSYCYWCLTLVWILTSFQDFSNKEVYFYYVNNRAVTPFLHGIKISWFFLPASSKNTIYNWFMVQQISFFCGKKIFPLTGDTHSLKTQQSLVQLN